MNRLVKTLLLTTTLILLVGCSNNVEKEQKKAETKNETTIEKKETKQLSIQPLKIAEESINKETKIIKIDYKIKKISDKKFQVAANDFIIKVGSEYYYMGDGDNYADTIKAGGNSEGSGYYSVPKDTKKITLMYQPLDNDERAQWDLTVPANK